MLEDYRADLTIDRRHEEADRAVGTKLQCPTLVLWSEHDDLEELYGDPLAIWTNWALDLTGHRIDSGHHMAEEAPTPLADALATFLTTRGAGEGQPHPTPRAQCDCPVRFSDRNDSMAAW